MLQHTELADDPYLQETGFLQAMAHPTEGQLVTPAIPVAFAEAPGAVRLPAPNLGEHTAEILQELGYDAPAIIAVSQGDCIWIFLSVSARHSRVRVCEKIEDTGLPETKDPIQAVKLECSFLIIRNSIQKHRLFRNGRERARFFHMLVRGNDGGEGWRNSHMQSPWSLPHFHCFLKRRCGILRLLDKHLCRRQPKSPGFQHPSLRPWFCSVWVSSASAW